MRIVDVSVNRPVFTTVMILALFVFGIWAYPKIGVDELPEVEFPFVTVVAIYPGADPETVESKLADPLEAAVNTVTGIDELRSTSAESVAMVMIRFELERDADQAVQDVRDKVAGIVGSLPSDVETPIVQKLDIGAAPIMSLVVSGDIPVRTLTELAEEKVQEKLQTLNGVGNIDIVGGQVREFHINVDPVALRGYNLSVDDVSRSLASQSVEVPGGRIDQAESELTIRTRGDVRTVPEIEQIVIGSPDGRPIRVIDVAEVLDTQEEKRSDASLNGRTALSLTVQKQSGANTVAVAHSVHAQLDAIRADLAEDGVELSVSMDNSTYIEHTINDVEFDLMLGALLAVIIIMVFLRDWRATLISALALPTSVVATIAFIHVMGFTLNMMTMLALTLSIGILIDDAIVVIENIHRHLEMGKSPRQAAREGTAEIGLAVLAITASIIAVFVPVATMKGMIGRFFYQFGMTVAFAVATSLFVAFTLAPMASARLLKSQHDHEPGMISRVIDRLLTGLEQAYENLVRAALRHWVVTLVVSLGLFVGSLSLFQFISVEFMPVQDRGEFNVFVETPAGSSLDKTQRIVNDVATDIRDIPGVQTTLTTIGGGTGGDVNRGIIFVKMVSNKERTFHQEEAMDYVRKQVESRGDAVYAIEPISGIGGGGNKRQGQLQYVLLGEDTDKLNDAADAMIAELRQVPGFVDVDKSSRTGKPEVQVEINRARAADLGVPVASIAMTIRTLYTGDDVIEIATDGERYDAVVRMQEQYRGSIADMLNVPVRSMSGDLVPLSQVVRLVDGEGASEIERFNRQRQVTVMANLKGLALGDATAHVEAAAAKVLSDDVESASAGNAEFLRETIGYMIEAIILAIILIFLILAAQFESFVHPLTIMVSLPLSLIGALGALALFGMSMNIFTMIGLIMLMGLVTKNAVLLVDYTNTLRAQGMERYEALVTAGRVRLRPILMTTAAMIGGMTPVALAMSAGGEERAPMATAIIGGLITSTLLTLVAVPVVYQTLDRIIDRVAFWRKDDEAQPAVATATAAADDGVEGEAE